VPASARELAPTKPAWNARAPRVTLSHDIDSTRKEVHDMKLNPIQNDTFTGSTARCAGADVTGPAMPGTDLSITGGSAAAIA
jgi:hypothetical protein